MAFNLKQINLDIFDIHENDFYIIPPKIIVVCCVIVPIGLSWCCFVGACLSPFILAESIPYLCGVLKNVFCSPYYVHKKIKKYLKKNKVFQEIKIENIEVAQVVYIIPIQNELNNPKCYKYPEAQIVKVYYIEPL